MLEYPIVVYEEIAPCWTVYKHTNKVNGKGYIGITSKTDIQRRWRYGSGYYSMIFGGAIAKYGWNNFNHDILLSGVTKYVAGIMEMYYIKKHETHISTGKGYNYEVGGFRGQVGIKKRRSDILKISGENNKASKKVVCLNTRKIYVSYKDAAKDVGLSRGCQIGAVCSGKSQFAGYDNDGNPLIWVNYEDYINMSEREIKEKLNTMILTTNSHPIICLNNSQIFSSVGEASEYGHSATSGIIRCCQTYAGNQTGHPRKHSGVHPETGELLSWMYLDDFNKLSRISQSELLKIKHPKQIKYKPIICLNSLQVFESHLSIIGFTSINVKKHLRSIGKYCDENNLEKHAARNPKTNEPLRWMYYDKYSELSDVERQELKDRYYTGNLLVSKEECNNGYNN